MKYAIACLLAVSAAAWDDAYFNSPAIDYNAPAPGGKVPLPLVVMDPLPLVVMASLPPVTVVPDPPTTPLLLVATAAPLLV
eukprot:CAMPEP_0170461578 /NCGR_PEP_ID=MMETSP0123-20130129/7424_1 /TAXON_ID=182087 /ORGANISM="Favella ehrenbergii, Strain Fehren 1" /LENGTH=80 /DNA_ID=CAMNT_0010726619 /DNA_START=15 /DNA_END=255 /DNA_ORIENTATION=+